jgi:FKBP-type peptidyl-prolyl cis-trans isomerase 2
MKKVCVFALVAMMSISTFSINAYDVQSGDNALLSKVYDRIDKVYEQDHTKLIRFLDSLLTYQIRYSWDPQSAYFLEKIIEYSEGKLYRFTTSPSFICLQDRVQYDDTVTLWYLLKPLGAEWSLHAITGEDRVSDNDLVFTVGKRQVIRGLDEGMVWKKLAVKYASVIEARDARWVDQERLILSMPTGTALAQRPDLQVWDRVAMQVTIDNQTVLAKWIVHEIDAENTRIDFNHPQAWENIGAWYTINSFFKGCD